MARWSHDHNVQRHALTQGAEPFYLW